LRRVSVSVWRMIMMTLKSTTIIAAFLAGGTSLALAQNGLPTGGQPPVAGGAAGNPITNPEYYGGYYATGGYIAAPGYLTPGYVAPGYVAPGYVAQPGYTAAPGYVAQPGYVEAPRRLATTHPRNLYMSATGIHHKRLETGQPLPKQPRQAQ
jgi:hypothetical protein